MVKVNRKTAVSFLIHAAVFLLIAGIFAYGKGIFAQTTAAGVMHILSDAFLLPGILFAGIAGLSWAASKGAYDSFRYLFYNFALHTIWVTKPKTHYDSLYDYKAAKDKKGRRWFPHMLFTGLAGIVIALVFLLLYFICTPS